MEIDRLLRRCRVALDTRELPLRPREALEEFTAGEVAGERVMLDSCVLIDQLQGRLPEAVEQRILARTIVHSPVVVGELSFLLGRLNPRHPGTADACREIAALLRAIPEHRVFDLRPEDTVRGNILAGCMARLLGYPPESRRKAQGDAILAAQAARTGCLLVTRNVADFDRLAQLEPKLRIAVY